MFRVALRKESVDRNLVIRMVLTLLIVALRKESVDRNLISILLRVFPFFASLSARRAWIEIDEQIEQESTPEVALRKESVDRN